MGAGGEGDDKGWDGSMASPTRWTWHWVNSRSWWWTGRPGVLQFMGSQRVRHNWVTELNWKATHNPFWTISYVNKCHLYNCWNKGTILFFFKREESCPRISSGWLGKGFSLFWILRIQNKMPTNVLFKLIPTDNNQVSQPLILDSIIYKAKRSEVSGNVIKPGPSKYMSTCFTWNFSHLCLLVCYLTGSGTLFGWYGGFILCICQGFFKNLNHFSLSSPLPPLNPETPRMCLLETWIKEI